MSGKNAAPSITWGGLASTTNMIGLVGKRKKKKKTKSKKTKRR